MQSKQKYGILLQSLNSAIKKINKYNTTTSKLILYFNMIYDVKILLIFLMFLFIDVIHH